MKAIKYLTQEDVNNIHNKHYDKWKGCVNCPLAAIDFINDCKTFKKEMQQHLKFLDRKIKV